MLSDCMFGVRGIGIDSSVPRIPLTNEVAIKQTISASLFQNWYLGCSGVWGTGLADVKSTFSDYRVPAFWKSARAVGYALLGMYVWFAIYLYISHFF